jgi:hypothetical protein
VPFVLLAEMGRIVVTHLVSGGGGQHRRPEGAGEPPALTRYKRVIVNIVP